MSVQLVTDREIRDAVLTLIKDARQEITLVSPYNENLADLVTALESAQRRRVKVVWYYNTMSSNLEKMSLKLIVSK